MTIQCPCYEPRWSQSSDTKVCVKKDQRVFLKYFQQYIDGHYG